MPYQIVHRSVISYGGTENFPLTRPGVAANALAGYPAFPTGLVRLNTSDLLAIYTRGAGHAGAGQVPVVSRSSDGGRTWGNPARDEVTIWNPDPTRRTLPGGCTVLRSGRIACTCFWDRLDATTPSRGGALLYSDDNGQTWTAGAAFPVVGTMFTEPTGKPIELPSGRLLVPIYWRDLSENRYTSSLYYSDGGVAGPWTLLSHIARDPSAGGLQYEEPQCIRLADTRLLCLIRDDLNRQIWQRFSSDDGATWGPLTAAFPGIGWPSLAQMPNGDILAISRHTDGGLGTDAGARGFLRVSSDLAVTWQAEQDLAGGGMEIGAYMYGEVLPLGGTRVAISHAVATLAAPFGSARTEFLILDSAPASIGSYGRYGLDAAPRPSQYADLNLIAVYRSEDFRYRNLLNPTPVDRWTNWMGNPDLDLVGTGAARMLFLDGSDLQAAGGLLGGIGCVTSHDLVNHMSMDRPVAMAQPLTIVIACDARADTADRIFFGDAVIQLRKNDTVIRLSAGGPSRTWAIGAWPPGAQVMTLILDGTNSILRLNGITQTVSAAGTVSIAAMTDFRLDGAANDGAISSVKEIWICGTTNASRIGDLEQALLAKHRILS